MSDSEFKVRLLSWLVGSLAGSNIWKIDKNVQSSYIGGPLMGQKLALVQRQVAVGQGKHREFGNESILLFCLVKSFIFAKPEMKTDELITFNISLICISLFPTDIRLL